jgi:hypothetical protein
MILVFDSGLILTTGHHLRYAKLFRSASMDLGFGCNFFTVKAATAPAVLAVATPLLSNYLYAKIDINNIRKCISDHFSEVSSAINTYSANDTTVFFPNAGILDLLIAPLIAGSFAGINIRLILRYPVISNLFQSSIDSTSAYLEALRFAANLPNTRLLTDTIDLKQLWELNGANVSLVPVPVSPTLFRNSAAGDRHYMFSLLGHTGDHKGRDKIISGLGRIAELGFNPSVFCQTSFMNVPPEVATVLPNVKFNSAALSDFEYDETLNATTFGICQYDPVHYRYGSSNLFLELLVAGCIPISTRFSFAVRTFHEFDYPIRLWVDFSEDSLMERLLQILRNPIDLERFRSQITSIAEQVALRCHPTRLVKAVLSPELA